MGRIFEVDDGYYDVGVRYRYDGQTWCWGMYDGELGNNKNGGSISSYSTSRRTLHVFRDFPAWTILLRPQLCLTNIKHGECRPTGYVHQRPQQRVDLIMSNSLYLTLIWINTDARVYPRFDNAKPHHHRRFDKIMIYRKIMIYWKWDSSHPFQ
jgi:hypothetical protein